ncbi:hypothetical protein RSP816_08650 [Ralstonia solanacearum]|nr:hypothetical protein RSP816_08650 [Ralstonia solanacearum]
MFPRRCSLCMPVCPLAQCIAMARVDAGGHANRTTHSHRPARIGADAPEAGAVTPARAARGTRRETYRMPCLTGWTGPRDFCYLHGSPTHAAERVPNIPWRVLNEADSASRRCPVGGGTRQQSL